MKELIKARGRGFRGWQLLSVALLFGFSFNLVADDLPLSETHLADMEGEEYFRIGEEVTGQVCTLCHGWDVVLSSRLTPPEWRFLVSDMIGRGASATPEQEEFIGRFMAWAWGKVSVNSASAEDLALVIGLSKSQADAVVAYREENGAFADVDSLKQVPGIDTAAVDSQADALQFN